MKKRILIIIFCISVLSVFCACNSNRQKISEASSSKLKIVTTIFPEYDWVRNIIGRNTNIEPILLLSNGTDLHSYQPSVDDIVKISTCDIFVYVGGESDGWVNDALKNATNKNMVVVNLMESLKDSIKEEEHTGVMQVAEEESEEKEFDEHIWLSLKNAAKIVNILEETIEKADPVNAAAYRKNANSYIKEINKLDEEYIKTISDSKTKTLIFGDRFPFRYLTDDYDLTYYAAFPGCSAETEASFETITRLAEKTDEYSAGCIITIDSSDDKIAKSIINNTKSKNQKILSLNSIQSVTKDDIENDITYLSIMKNNLSVIKEALN